MMEPGTLKAFAFPQRNNVIPAQRGIDVSIKVDNQGRDDRLKRTDDGFDFIEERNDIKGDLFDCINRSII